MPGPMLSILHVVSYRNPQSKVSNINFIFTDDKIEHSNTVISPRCAVSGEVGICVCEAHGLSILDI